MFLTQTASDYYDSILCLVYPQSCTICGRCVESRSLGPACLTCWQTTRLIASNEAMCWKCGALARQTARVVEPESVRCHKCELHLFSAARACGLYAGALRASVLQLKRQPHVAKKLVSVLVDVAQRPPLNQSTVIIPVPLHPEREKRRGFNQAAEIAQALAPLLQLPVNMQSLVRITAAGKYRAGLDAKGRLETVAGAFEVRVPRLIEHETVLLIDDVFTTGATASSCAMGLLAAGAKSVYILTLARPGECIALPTHRLP
jgi:ComF family protein